MNSVAAVVLAAGRSSRFVGPLPKQLVEFEGKPLVRRAVEAALGEERIGQVVLVVGWRSDEVRATVEDLLGDDRLSVAENPGFAEGQSTSVRCGLKTAEDSSAVVFLPVDQPYLDSAHLGRLLDAFDAGAAIAVSAAAGRRGAPVLFTSSYFVELMKLEGDEGGRQVLRRCPEAIVEVEALHARVLQDVDTVDDLERLTQRVVAS